jgi:NAD(P)H-dependent FMN reductase
MKKILIITSSTRPVRNGVKVSNWVFEESKLTNLELEFEILDLKELNLPFLDEPVSPRSGQEYVHEHTKNWSRIVDEASGFIIVLPEYNGGYPAPLKNALDYLYNEWTKKPVGIVGYGGGGASRSTKQLREVLLSLEMVPMDNQIGIKGVWSAFDKDNKLLSEFVDGNIQELFVEMKKHL